MRDLYDGSPVPAEDWSRGSAPGRRSCRCQRSTATPRTVPHRRQSTRFARPSSFAGDPVPRSGRGRDAKATGRLRSLKVTSRVPRPETVAPDRRAAGGVPSSDRPAPGPARAKRYLAKRRADVAPHHCRRPTTAATSVDRPACSRLVHRHMSAADAKPAWQAESTTTATVDAENEIQREPSRITPTDR